MTFDYYDGVTHDMAAATQTAATGLVSQLKGVWPGKTDAQYWNQVGIIEMNGQDDYANDTGNLSAEVFTLANATTVTNWAKAKGIGALSFWALQRDNGGCPGQAPGERNCSGVAQSTWQFSQLMRSFTSGATNSPTPSASASSASPSTPSSPSPSVSTPAGTAWEAGTAYKVGQIVTYNGKRYQCRQAHTAIVSWEPPNVLALWLPL
ncbi:hypothetical protein Apa02nite_063790 [Actinoplanes palleronii]|uniref:Chitin-binding type-3 domain-containing protein n=2 Tax=Actinoplanes palleronii TaxID=113570 RepID=A0ABQ4BJ08_9ACTN|nr:hypothetical protein Apa02nite_063790 [Actinoplanes palleronii]